MRKLQHSEILEQRHTVSEMQVVNRFPLILFLHNIRSMHNIGSFFRTADAACIKKIIITGYTAIPPREEINKTALGATETIEWEYFKDPLEAISKLKAENVLITCLEQTTKSQSIYDFTAPDRPICLILGNEVFGVDDHLLEAADLALEIPMFGFKHSLNVSVACGIAVFELIRKMKRDL